MHFNINTNSYNNRFKINFSGSYLIDNNKLPNNDLTRASIVLEPHAPTLFNPDGSLNWGISPSGFATFENPLQYLYNAYTNETNNLIGSGSFSYAILKNLELKTTLGYNNMQTSDFQANPTIGINPNLRPFISNSAGFGTRTLNSWIIEPQISFKRKFKNTNIDVLFGGTIQANNNFSRTMVGMGFGNDEMLRDINSASAVYPAGTVNLKYKYSGAFLRVNYNLLDKYIVNITGRRDGSSRFGSG